MWKYVTAALIPLAPIAAWADTAPAPGREGFTPLIPLVLIFAVFYFMVIRPQQKRAKTHEQFLVGLKRGDMVVTNGGIVGTIRQVSERFVTLEVDEGVSLKMLRSQIAESAAALNKEDDKDKTKG